MLEHAQRCSKKCHCKSNAQKCFKHVQHMPKVMASSKRVGCKFAEYFYIGRSSWTRIKTSAASKTCHSASLMPQEGGRVQGWESICWGVRGFFASWFRNFLVSKFLGFLDSGFLGLLVSTCLGFLVSKFHRFTNSNVNIVWKMMVPYYQNSISCF